MMEKIDPVIASRDLLYVADSGERSICSIIIGSPRNTQDLGCGCPFQIGEKDNAKIRYAYGVDSFQSLQLMFEHLNLFFNLMKEKGKFYYEPDIHADISALEELKEDFILPRNLYD